MYPPQKKRQEEVNEQQLSEQVLSKIWAKNFILRLYKGKHGPMASILVNQKKKKSIK